jgi:hypothetical protein
VQAGEFLKPVLAAINRTTESSQLGALTDAYRAVSGRLSPNDACEVVTPVLAAINQTTDPGQLGAAGRRL